MHVRVFGDHITQEERAIIEDYFEKKRPRIEKFLTHFDEDTVKLSLNVKKIIQKEAFIVEMVMNVPKTRKTLCAKEDSRDIHKAMDLCTDRLVEQLKKAMDKLHHEHEHAA